MEGSTDALVVSSYAFESVRQVHVFCFSLPAVIYFSKMLFIGVLLMFQSWSGHLERWARYVVRCEIQYPGPIDTFTNFGKIDMVCLL